MTGAPDARDGVDNRIAWAAQMRLKFSPPAILKPDGTIDQGFFKPEKVIVLEERLWGDSEQDKLFEGIRRFGVGQWQEISSTFLPEWGEQTIRLWTMRTLGSQSLARYMAWKGSREDVEDERHKNRDLGKRLGCWKGGLLVEDDDGTVARELEAAGRMDVRKGEPNGGRPQTAEDMDSEATQ
eukprot:evm.model.scf_473.1 EVM.evm.TU.scf_473.1   scf_473:766-1555(+)